MLARAHAELRAAYADLALHVAWLGLKFAGAWLERRYRPDQPRAPKGTPEGGQWVPDRVRVAATRCDGFSAGCQNGGTFGSSGSIQIGPKKLCWDCAIRYLGLENESRDIQLKTIKNFDPKHRE